MKKNWKFLVTMLAIVSIALAGILSTGASWAVQTQATGNSLTAGTFNVTIGNQFVGDTGTQTVSGTWVSPANWAPGDDPVYGKIYLHNGGNVDVNVVWSGFSLTGDSVLADNICVTELADSMGQTNISDLAGFIDPIAGCVTLSKAAQALGDGYYSNPNGNDSHSSIFIPAGGDAWVDMTLAFRAGAGNDTIGKSAGFTWYLTAQQLPKNATP